MAERQQFRGTARYQIVRPIGEGGMGTVYEAFDRESETTVALKVLRKIDPQLRLRFKREFRAVQGLEHRNLVRLGELVEDAGALFYTMEFVRGVNFLSHVRPQDRTDPPSGSPPTLDLRPPRRAETPNKATPLDETASPRPSVSSEIEFDEDKLRAALRELALGLSRLHGDGKLHRDVKPSNVLVEPNGRTVLLDFGLVLPTADTRITSAGGALGTAVYMAPEQALERELDSAADWYSVGAMLYEALTGRVPFDGPTFEVMVEKQQRVPPPPRKWVPDIPEDLDSLCIALLQIDPADRPSSEEILQRVQADLPGDEPRRRRASQPPSPAPDMTAPGAFVGREAELDELQAAYAAASSEAVTVIIDGQSGVGKTELVRHFTTRLSTQTPPPVILAGRCYERESIPYKAVDGVIDALSTFLASLERDAARAYMPRRRGLLRMLFPVLRRVEAIATAPFERRSIVDPLQQRDDTFRALRELLSRISRDRRVVIVVDDLQWTDTDSLALLSALLRQPEAPAILLVTTLRTNDRGNLPALVRDGLSDVADGVHQLSLGPLTAASARQLAATVVPELRRDLSGTARAIVGEAGGHPMFLLELLRYMQNNPGRGLSIRLDDALWSRVTNLPAEARAALETVCVAGSPLAQGVVAYAVEQDGATWARSVSQLRAANFARTTGDRPIDLIEPYHDRVREAVTANLAKKDEDQNHERLALALECAGIGEANPNALIRHLVAIGDFDRAARNAERAAEVASRALAFDRAVALCETTLEYGAPTYTSSDLQLVRMQLADALANAGRSAEAGDAYVAAADAADAETQLMCQRKAAEHYLISGHLERAKDSVTSVLRRFDVAYPPTARSALTSLLWNRFKLRLRGRRWKERTEQEIPPEEMARYDVLRSIAQGLGPVDNLRAADFNSRATLLALRMGEPTRVATALGYESIFSSIEGGRKLRRGRAILDEALAIAKRLDDPKLDASLGLAECMLCFTTGRFLEGERLLTESETLLGQGAGTHWELTQARLFRLQSLRFMGRYEELGREFEKLSRMATQRGDRYTETSMNRSHSFLALVADDPERARALREATTWVPPAGVFHLQHWYDLRARSEIYLYDQTVAEHFDELSSDFEQMRRSLLPRIQLTRVLSAWTWGRVLLATGLARDSSKLIDRAAQVSRKIAREQTGYSDAWGGLLAAGLAMHGEGAKAAQPILEHTAARADEHHMGLIAAVARRRLGRILGGAKGNALIQAADEWMRSETIRNPERMSETMCPGFARHR